MLIKIPILLSFYAISNGHELLAFGQLTYTRLHDLTFKSFSGRRTFRTLVSLYRTKTFAGQTIALHFDTGTFETKTDATGAFFIRSKFDKNPTSLQKILLQSEQEVKIMEGLYVCSVHEVVENLIVVSDIDDTLLHSFIKNKLRKFRTLMFTAVEKRKAVVNTQKLVHYLARKGAATFYLSNSEQNLHPLIYRFLLHNKFPQGPLFLKQMRKLWDVFRNIKTPLADIHKKKSLEHILSLFPNRKFALIGDNTQHDLNIYLHASDQYPEAIKYILIRKVVENMQDDVLIKKYTEKLRQRKITLFYDENFPSALE